MMPVRLHCKVKGIVLLLTLPCFVLAAAVAWSASQEGVVEYLSPHNASEETKNPDACSTCHSTHTAQRRSLVSVDDLADSCINCHNGTNSTAPMFPNNNLMHNFGEESDKSCNGCHQMHPPYRYEPLLSRPYTSEAHKRNLQITGNTSDYRLCLDCHRRDGDDGAADIFSYYTAGTGHYIRSAGGRLPIEGEDNDLPPGWQLSCSNCHDQHGSVNAALIRNDITIEKGEEGTQQEVVSLDFPERPSVSGQMRDFCLTCHGEESYLYHLSLTPPSTISEHTSDGNESCENCHGYIRNLEEQDMAMKAAHAPLVPSPNISGYIVEAELAEEGIFGLLQVNLYYDGNHLNPQRDVPFIGKPVQFLISEDGYFVEREEEEGWVVYRQLEYPQHQKTVEHVDEDTEETLGLAYIWFFAPDETTTTIRVFSGGASREFNITP
ncbi:cytochrome c3 family protein [Dethiobacter alkaliphilus]|uniref:Doubled CXXCH motif domain-containing protein n=1 Tax=Dethiobacter alkaliphilus AHT 1 TaxID=555088 RepID=C0GF35_DETAL|nr:cytochrome c3 family protein [Dethiobacter alkaliphilus]EEG78217.1 hypothetical protein DealDRAFT_1094 [Dethiobacter alkaliphilus AHT 1]